MDVSCTFDKDGSELVLMMTDGVSSEREKCLCILQLAWHRVIQKHIYTQIYNILLFAPGKW